MIEAGDLHKDNNVSIPEILPLLPVRDLVIFPFMIVPLHVARPLSARAVEAAMKEKQLVLLCSQKNAASENPSPEEIYSVGTIGKIMRSKKGDNGDYKILVQGLLKAEIKEYCKHDPYFIVKAEKIPDFDGYQPGIELEALMRTVKENIELLAKHGHQIGEDVLMVVSEMQEPGRLADLAASHLGLQVSQAQDLFELNNPQQRLGKVNELLAKEVAVVAVQMELQNQTKEELFRSQREYILRQQLEKIQAELGETESDSELDELSELLAKAKLTKEARRVAEKQFSRLKKMNLEGSEATVVRTYLDWLVEFPWLQTTKDVYDIAHAKKILDENHSHLELVKERVLEYLAVRHLNPESKGPLLCFVGPPGVGKTSLGKSIAEALGRKYVRISMGGVRDEAEIRGHRRTYVGAMPGRIIQGLHQARSCNPVIIIDEIDKMGMDQRGDPASALLEVLDPEQNQTFRDHYLNIPTDLSKVLFIATANRVDSLPPALRDRLEVIHLSGYSEEEKLEIAHKYLIPVLVRDHGLEKYNIQLSNKIITHVIGHYTREAGLRQLQRLIATICRKVARTVAESSQKPKNQHRISIKQIRKMLGPPPFEPGPEQLDDEMGVAIGLAWTPVGGEVLHVEATAMKGKPSLMLTGQLGDVMKESAQTALSYVRTSTDLLKIPEKYFDTHLIHIHVPAGALPKDGPSAGITIAASLASLATGKALRHDVAMTGEITLRGRVLPVGGIKEKVLAALRHGITSVIIPQGNQKDLEHLPSYVKRRIAIIPITKLEQALSHVLVKN